MSPIHELIAQHRAALATVSLLADANTPDDGMIAVADRSAHDVLVELFAAPVRSLDDAAAKTVYLADEIPDGVGDYFGEERHLSAFLGSFRQQPAESDPLLGLIDRYKAEEDRLNAAGLVDEEMDAEIDYLNEILDELRNWTKPATTATSAAVALKFASDFMVHSSGGYEHSMIAAALGFLEGRAGA